MRFVVLAMILVLSVPSQLRVWVNGDLVAQPSSDAPSGLL